MINIVDHVPDIETCRKLKEAGFPQDTQFHWNEIMGEDGGIMYGEISEGDAIDCYAAPLASEIMDKLPSKYALSKCGGINLENDWTVFNCDDNDESETMNTNPATACALMWLKLRKEGKSREIYEKGESK